MKKQSRTCIAIVKTKRGKLIMAGDRRASWHWGHAESMNRPKVMKRNGLLLGATGNGSLCSLLVDLMVIPSIKTDINTYMFFTFREAVLKILLNQGYGDKDKNLHIPPDSGVSLVVGIQGHAFVVDIDNPYDTEHTTKGGLISIDEVSTPFATGCGGPSALPILLAERKREGHSTKEHLKLAMEIAADISPGCNNLIDFIQE